MSNVNCSQLKCFTLTLLICVPAPTMRLRGLRDDLGKVQDVGPSLTLAFSPDRVVLLTDSNAHPGASSAWVEDSESLVSGMDIEFTTSELSSSDDKAQEELL